MTEVSTRVDLALLGIRVDVPVQRRSGAGPSDDGHVLFGGAGAAIPIRSDSPYTLRGDRLLLDGADLGVSIEPVQRPRFYELSTTDGVPYEQIAKLHGADVLATTVVQTCIRYSEDQRCRFCAIEQYRSAADLPPGAVLVVGTGQSGAQIAEDLHLEGRQVHLAVGSAPRVARFYRGRDCVAWLQDMRHYDIPIEDQPGGLGKRENTNHYVTGRDGGRDIDLRQFASEGMALYGRMIDVNGGAAYFEPSLEKALDAADAVAESIKNSIDAYIEREGIDAPVESRYVPVWRPDRETTETDLEAHGITSVIWSVGFRTDYRWLRVGVFDGEGHPCHNRGVTITPGLYFLGLPWLHTWGSGRFAAIARDAEYLADRITVTSRRSVAA